MRKVITYGTFDMLHYGHVRLLERAKELGNYLIVAVTSDDFDKSRGKINAVQSLEERIENVRKTGLADKIIVEEYEGQKIADVKRYGVDVFTVGSDWIGKFDYLERYCEVVYLPRTEGVSSTDIRSVKNHLKIGFIGDYPPMIKCMKECEFVNGLVVTGIVSSNEVLISYSKDKKIPIFDKFSDLLDNVDAVYITLDPNLHYQYIKEAIESGKHVLCQSPICTSVEDYRKLNSLATQNGVVLMDAIKTNHSLAFNRMCLMLETGVIGDIVSIDTTCTVVREAPIKGWNSMCSWGPVSLLPIFKILGDDPLKIEIISKMEDSYYDTFTKINLLYKHAVASAKIGIGVKSEGDMIISGTKGYIYVPAPWWKTDYFEIRHEDSNDNGRYYYELLGEGIRGMLHDFLAAINQDLICENHSEIIVKCVQSFMDGRRDEI